MTQQYSHAYPGGRCYWCKNVFTRISRKVGYEHAGEYTYIDGVSELGVPVKLHVNCALRHKKRLTATPDFQVIMNLTARKPAHA